MKKLMTMILALMLVVGLLAVPVSAETAKGESDTVEDAVLTIGAAGEEYLGEVAVEEFAEQVQDAVEDVQDTVEAVEEGVEKVSGFVAWFMNLVEKILDFFGL